MKRYPDPPEMPPWQCPKCTSSRYEVGEFRGSGGGLAGALDWNRRMSTVTCRRCAYTELYAVEADEVLKTLALIARLPKQATEP